jgi:hypothetical protein
MMHRDELVNGILDVHGILFSMHPTDVKVALAEENDALIREVSHRARDLHGLDLDDPATAETTLRAIEVLVSGAQFLAHLKVCGGSSLHRWHECTAEPPAPEDSIFPYMLLYASTSLLEHCAATVRVAQSDVLDGLDDL